MQIYKLHETVTSPEEGVKVIFRDRPSDSPFVEKVWSSYSQGSGMFTSIAASHWMIVVTRLQDKLTLDIQGPETKATNAHCPADGEWTGILFKFGTFMPLFPTSTLVDGAVTLPALGADETISLSGSDQDITEAFECAINQKNIDVILDYAWGRPAEMLLQALTRHDIKADVARTRYVSIGEMAGSDIALSSATLRSSGIELYGSGGGSVAPQAIYETFPKMWALAASGKLYIDVESAPLADGETFWKRGDIDGRRLVFIP